MYLDLGYFSISLSLGLILGASNTPVAGAFITAFFGLLGTVIGAQYLFDKSNSLPLSQKNIGLGLLVVSIGLIAGTLLGEIYRNIDTKNSNNLQISFPWKGLETPQNTYEALDWIQVQKKLKKQGYTQEQIQGIYKIRVSERQKMETTVQKEIEQGLPSYEQSKVYDSATPFHGFVSEIQSPPSSNKGRGLASE